MIELLKKPYPDTASSLTYYPNLIYTEAVLIEDKANGGL